MNRRTAFALGVALLCTLLVARAARANATPGIIRHVLGGGGGHTEAAQYTLDGTIGQAVVGHSADTDTEICSGFWCDVGLRYPVHLPLVLRSN
jgi:hypothetical protein